MKYAQLGSVSSGTLRDEDLLSAFASELDYQLGRQPKSFPRREHRKLILDARHALAVGEDADDTSGIVSDLFEALDSFAPPLAYFGAVEGDGADFGYWLSHDAIRDFDGLRVADTSEVPRDYRGEVLHTSDHGNLTLYVANGRGKLTEVWGVV